MIVEFCTSEPCDKSEPYTRKLIFKFKGAAAACLSSVCSRARAVFLYSRMLTMLQRDNFHLRLTRGVNVSVHCHPNNACATKGTRRFPTTWTS